MNYTLLAATGYLALFGVWSKQGWHNVACKVGFLAMGVWGLVVYFK